MKNSVQKLFIAIILLSIPGLSHGQWDFSLGIKGGGMRSTVNNDDQQISATESIESTSLRPKGDIGWTIGISSFIEKEQVIGNYILQPELLFTKSSGVIRYITESGGTETVNKLNETYKTLDLPLMFGYRILFMRFYAGPTFSFLLDMDSEMDDLPQFDRSFQNFSVGYKIGLGLNEKGKYVDIYYQQVGNIDNPIGFNGPSFNLNSRQLQFGVTLGYFWQVPSKFSKRDQEN